MLQGHLSVVKAADPATIDGQYAGTGQIGQGVESTMTVLGRGNVPTSGVGAVALNVTVTNPTMGSFLTVWPTGAPRPLASNLNFVPGQTVANAVITKVGTSGKISVFNNGGGVDVIIDVVGWFPDNQSYVGLTPRGSPTPASSPRSMASSPTPVHSGRVACPTSRCSAAAVSPLRGSVPSP